MAVWRPQPAIRVKVLGLVWRGPELLALEVPDDRGAIIGVRPPGGTIEFGETREQALSRELEEELGFGIEIIGPWISIENIFEHHGARGHEFIFAANVRPLNVFLDDRDELRLVESDQSIWTARWFVPHDLPPGIPLLPRGLAPLLVPPTI